MECNETCCIFQEEDGSITVLCFNELNFTDFSDLEETPAWNMAVRWTYVTPIVLLGVLGNLAIIIILFNNRLLMRTSVNYFILNMAVSDLILAIAGPILFTIRDTNQFWVLGEFWCHMDGFLQVMVMVVTALSLCTISIDRLLGVLHSTHRHLRHWQAFFIITSIWVFSAACAVPFYIFRNFGIRQWNDLTEVYCGEQTDKTEIYWLVIIVVLNWIPLTVMLVCYIKLFVEFKKHAMKVFGKEHPGILNMKKKFLKMLFTMILVYMACWLPFQAFVIFRDKLIRQDNSQTENEEVYDIVFSTSQYLVYLNPAINPFIYGLMHANFKKGFRVTFSCFFKNEPNFVLMRAYGTYEYAWNRRDRTRHTIPTSGYKNRNSRSSDFGNQQKVLRRAFSFDYSPDPRRLRFRAKSASLLPESAEMNGKINDSRKLSCPNAF